MIKAQKDLCVCFVIIINPPPNHNTCKRYRRNDRSVVVHKISYAFLPIYNVVLRSNILKENKNICGEKKPDKLLFPDQLQNANSRSNPLTIDKTA